MLAYATLLHPFPKRYLTTFIDNYSRKTWIYFLAEKLDAFYTFKSYVEKETHS